MGLEKIDMLKKQKGLTNKDLAILSGVPKDTIDKITAGKTKDPKLDTIKAIMCALGCTLDDLDEKPQNTYLSQENQLITNCRLLSEEGKDKLIDYADDLVRSGKYEKYRALNEHGKKNIDTLLDNEYGRCKIESEKQAEIEYDIDSRTVEEIVAEIQQNRHFHVAASGTTPTMITLTPDEMKEAMEEYDKIMRNRKN